MFSFRVVVYIHTLYHCAAKRIGVMYALLLSVLYYMLYLLQCFNFPFMPCSGVGEGVKNSCFKGFCIFILLQRN